jgi:hypothetical protein
MGARDPLVTSGIIRYHQAHDRVDLLMARMPWLAAHLGRHGVIAGIAMIEGTYDDVDADDDDRGGDARAKVSGYSPAGGGIWYPPHWMPS